MPVTVTMPRLGETVTEGTILSWAKQVGDPIEEDEVLVEISTDKVDTEMPSPASGVILEILVQAGETVGVGTAIVIIGEAAEMVSVQEPAMGPTGTPAMGPTGTPAIGPTGTPAVGPTGASVEAPPPPAPPAPQPVATGDVSRRAILSPVVRRLAAEHDVDLELVPGSGDGGRITRKDVERYIATEPAAPPVAAPIPEPPVEVTTVAVPSPAPELEVEAPAPIPDPAPEPIIEAAPPAAASDATVVTMDEAPVTPTKVTITAGAGDEVVEIPRLRRTIADHMIHAKRTAAHVWTSIEVDYEQVEHVRAAHRDRFKAEEGFSLTYLPFIARAMMDALSAFPVANSSLDLDEGTITYHHGVNLGVAVDLDTQGLLVATVRGADGLTLKGLARSIRQMAEKARDGALDPDDISGSTFTITNPGPFGSYLSAPIINLPNVAILSTDTVKKRPTVVTLPDGTDTIAVRHIGYLGLTWDHRAFDGSVATKFLNRIQTNLETWDWDQELR
jgi:2-oxoglutarate dehydrogenase E2 component (dihydrolipoamide succinyltransferase)